jgi:exopolyphosphatase / guanosine-5'-triphosphate,3'-diphosphate pyrophosphatase
MERGTLSGAGIINSIIQVGEAYRFEAGHAIQVTRLALRLFDDLQPLHGMGNTERIWLRAAAMLHDVGKREDPKEHHKLALEIIVNSASLPFRAEERIIIGLTARYHRGSLPKSDHKYYRDLDDDTRLYVCKLACLLRLADGLDKGHSDLVEDLRCGIRRRRVIVRIVGREAPDMSVVFSKADLFEAVLQKRADFRIMAGSGRRGGPVDFHARPVYADIS